VPGTGWAALAVLAFSFTFPATHLALEGMSPVLVGAGRSVVGAAAGAVFLIVKRVPLPDRSTWPAFIIVAASAGIGFGLLSALALPIVGVAASGVTTGLLPIGTALTATFRAGERPSRGFWMASAAGTVLVVGFAIYRGGGGPSVADLLLLLALAMASVGYAEGGRLARSMPGWQVICWALVFALPLSLPVSLAAAVTEPPHPGTGALLGFAYVSLISVLLGFFAWNRGLATAGIARASQVQLAQPMLTLAWAALILNEAVSPLAIGVAAGVLACVAATQRFRISSVLEPAIDQREPQVIGGQANRAGATG
jgi:drug/metabolite transporter (DMT)-like permease